MSLVYIIGGGSQSSTTVITQPAPLPPRRCRCRPSATGGTRGTRHGLGRSRHHADGGTSGREHLCLAEAARQIGATGGSAISISNFVEFEPGNGGYRFRWVLAATYPDRARSIPAYCRATPDTVIELTFG